jgi:actin-related protein 9
MAFESLNVPGFSILPSPLASLFALNATTGTVIHVGKQSSLAVVITDSVVRWETAATIGVGMEDCERYLEELLMGDESLDRQIRELSGERRKLEIVREVVEVVFAECTGDDIDIIPNGGKKAVAQVAPEAEDESFDVAKK